MAVKDPLVNECGTTPCSRVERINEDREIWEDTARRLAFLVSLAYQVDADKILKEVHEHSLTRKNEELENQ